jgi:preprotein translocase subunit SecF
MTSKGDEKGRFNFIGRMNTGLMLSGIVVVISVVLLFTRGLNYGIDFKGGSIFHYHFDKDISEDTIRNLIDKSALKKDFGEVVVQRVLGQVDIGLIKEDAKVEKETKGSEFIIHTEASKEVIEAEDVEPKLEALFRSGDLGSFEKYERQFIGPTVGASLRSKAMLSLVIAILGILLYVSLRFEFVHAVAAVVALVHDSVIVLGIFALLQKEVNIGIMAALLTIIGYSLNDSIVILDRIRENSRLKGRLPYDQRVNLSLNQSLSRTINTSVTTFLAVLSLFVLGGVVIHDFALAMIIGVVVGTYSSVFVVSPILVLWYYREHENAPRGILPAA